MMMRSFSALSITEAMEMARDELGDDAIILKTDTKKGKGVTVTFGLDHDDEELFDQSEFHTPPINYSNDEAPLASSEQPLIQAMTDLLTHHCVPSHILDHLISKAKTLNIPSTASFNNLQNALEDTFEECLKFDPLPLQNKSTRIILVGPHGSGKTTAVAKIAAKMVVDNTPIRIISTDMKNAGGVEKLKALTSVLGIEISTASNRDELKELLQSFKPADRVIIDSAGCNPYDFQELKALGEFARFQDIKPVLVCSAGTDANEATEIAGVFSFLDIEHVIISRADCARHYGGLLSVATAAGYAFSHITKSSRAMGDLQQMDAAMLAQLFTQYQRERMAT